MRPACGGPTRIAGLVAAALLTAAALSGCGSASSSGPAPTRTARTTSAPPATPAAADGVIPVHVALPSIGVSAAVAALGETPAGDVQSPPDWDTVGWFSPGYRPGAPGHAVLNGHLDTNLASRPTAVFSNLAKLHRGDAVIVDGAAGGTLRYTVTALDYYPTEKVPLDQVFGPANESVLEMLTCAGTWRGTTLGYSQRLVVTAALNQR